MSTNGVIGPQATDCGTIRVRDTIDASDVVLACGPRQSVVDPGERVAVDVFATNRTDRSISFDLALEAGGQVVDSTSSSVRASVFDEQVATMAWSPSASGASFSPTLRASNVQPTSTARAAVDSVAATAEGVTGRGRGTVATAALGTAAGVAAAGLGVGGGGR